jgi:hypothetical protein
MAVTIVRTPWIDDDGTGTTGTVLNNAVKTALYNDIDGALAKVAQLAGGNTFTGNQSITGTVTVSGTGHVFSSVATGAFTTQFRNATAGTGNVMQLLLGNDATPALGVVGAYSTTYSTAVYNVQNGITIYSTGSGGLNFATTDAAGVQRFFTSSAERLRIAATGEVLINSVTNPLNAAVFLSVDHAAHPYGVAIMNTHTGNALPYLQFINSAQGSAGNISQTGVSSVAFNTSSDARLKTDYGRATDLTALRGVVIHDFAWTADDRHDRGVFAQEAAAVFPRAVSVGTDETTDAGALARPWMTDYSKFVPDLIVGWQHHDADLAELRALLVTLKGSADAE